MLVNLSKIENRSLSPYREKNDCLPSVYYVPQDRRKLILKLKDKASRSIYI